MAIPNFDSVAVGDALPPITTPPLNRTTLALFAGASGDHVPLHIDSDYARAAGMPDVFGHGMLNMAYLGRMLTHWVPQSQLRNFNARFTGITQLGDMLTCSGKVVEKLEKNGEKLIRVELQAQSQLGDRKAIGDALIALV